MQLVIPISIFFLLSFIGPSDSNSYSSFHPRLLLSDSKVTGVEGTKLQVNCTALVQNVSEIQSLRWIALQKKPTIRHWSPQNDTVSLAISSLHRSDAGTYTCMLVTTYGSEEKEEKAELRLFVRSKVKGSSTCRITEFKCKRTNLCVFQRYRCDGFDDCGDGSDENCEGDPCDNKFKCNNSRCISKEKLCDHVDDCGDGSDEYSCYEKKTRPSEAPKDNNSVSLPKNTIFLVIASVIFLVILVCFAIILGCRAKMKRQRREERLRPNANLNRRLSDMSEAPRYSTEPDENAGPSQSFLLNTYPSYPNGPNIIVNVNNGVQYMPQYDCSMRPFMDAPPPYSEVRSRNDVSENEPPPYTTVGQHDPPNHSSEPHCSGASQHNGDASSSNPNRERGAMDDATQFDAFGNDVHEASTIQSRPRSCVVQSQDNPLVTNGTPMSSFHDSNSPPLNGANNPSCLPPHNLPSMPTHNSSLTSDLQPYPDTDIMPAETSSAIGAVCSDTNPQVRIQPTASPYLTSSPDTMTVPRAKSPNYDTGDASTALLQEVSRRDERSKPQPGQLSIHGGQIVLHTDTGVIAGQSAMPSSTVDNSSASGDQSDPVRNEEPNMLGPGIFSPEEHKAAANQLGGEIVVKDGVIMLQIPVSKLIVNPQGGPQLPNQMELAQTETSQESLSSSDSLSHFPAGNPVHTTRPTNDNVNSDLSPSHASADHDSLRPETMSSALDTIGSVASSLSTSPNLNSRLCGDLNVRDGQIVLEPPRQTPSSQILSHLHSAENDPLLGDQGQSPLEAVGNTKRTPGGTNSGGRHFTAKQNTDVVLPHCGREHQDYLD